MKSEKKRIVVTGIGPLSSLGSGKDEIWSAILKEKTNVTLKKFYVDGQIWDQFYYHSLREFDIKNYDVDLEILDWIRGWKNGPIDDDLLCLSAVVSLAIKDSGITYNKEKNEIGLILTHENPGLEYFFDNIASAAFSFIRDSVTASGGCDISADVLTKIDKKELLSYVYQKCEKVGYDIQTFMYLFFVAKLFSLHGFSLFINNACASGLFALEVASQQIHLGKCPAVIVGGTDLQNKIYKHLWFKNINLYATDGLIKPFSANRNGFVFGEGGAALVLEEYENAKSRGAHIYAEYLGGDFSLEGGKVTIPASGIDYYANNMKKSAVGNGLSIEDIDVLIPHGIGTAVTDLHEARAIEKIFQSNSRLSITALKPYFGHNLGSCALLETSLLMLMMENHHVPRTLNCQPFDPKINLRIAVEPVNKPINIAMKTACGFAGYNGATVFRKI